MLFGSGSAGLGVVNPNKKQVVPIAVLVTRGLKEVSDHGVAPLSGASVPGVRLRGRIGLRGFVPRS